MEHDNRDRLETMIENALQSYIAAEPLAGLEERILNRIQATRLKTGPAYFPPVAVGGLALMLCLSFLALMGPREPLAPKDSIAAATSKHSIPNSSLIELPSTQPHRRIARAKHRGHPQSLAKQSMFPIPKPATGQERALVRFIDADPKGAVEAFASLRHKNDELITVQPIQVPPLQGGS